MTLFDLIKTANHNLFKNKLRTFLTLLAILVGSFAIITTVAIQSGVNNFLDKQVSSFGGNGFIEIFPKSLGEDLTDQTSLVQKPKEYNPEKSTSAGPNKMPAITEEQIERVKHTPGIISDSVMAGNFASLTYVESPENKKQFTINTSIFPTGSADFDMQSGRIPDNNSDSYEIMFTSDWTEALGFSNPEDALGKSVKLVYIDEYTKKPSEFSAKIVGIQNPSVMTSGSPIINQTLNDDIYTANLKSYASLLPADEYNKLKNETHFLAATYDYEKYSSAEIKSSLEDFGLTAMTIEDIIGTIKTFFDALAAILNAFGAIALLAAAIGIINTLFMAVQERTREIGLEKALGLSSFKVFLEFSIEAILIGFWGSLLGIALSTIAGNALNAFLHQPGNYLADFPSFNLVEYSPESILPIVLLLMTISFIAGTAPARAAAKKDPIDALRYE
ncbi:MAG: ABC transporter permease [Candidatus Saccharibacteria bacterium]|nr:ABC transporter permease [Candidatus Saccharibacteria bacterium]